MGKDLGKVAGEIEHIVDQHSKERLDYMVYKKTAEELYGKWPNLSISDKIWALFHIGAKFLERKQSDKAVLKQFPGQAMHEIGLDKYPQEMVRFVTGGYVGVPVYYVGVVMCYMGVGVAVWYMGVVVCYVGVIMCYMGVVVYYVGVCYMGVAVCNVGVACTYLQIKPIAVLVFDQTWNPSQVSTYRPGEKIPVS